MAKVHFTVEVGLTTAPGAIADLNCIAESGDNSPEVATVYLISSYIGDEGRTVEKLVEVPEPSWWRWNDPLLEAIAPQIWEQANSRLVELALEEAWAEANPQDAKDYWPDPVREHGTWNVRAL